MFNVSLKLQQQATRISDIFLHSRQGVWDVVVSMIPQFIGVITGFLSSILIARGLGPTDVGRLALVMSLSGLALSFSDLGIGSTAIRYASRAIAEGNQQAQMAILRWAFRLRLGIILIITVVFFLIARFIANHLWHDTSLTPFLRLGLFIGIFGALAAVPTIYFQSIKQFRMNTIVLSVQRIISFLGILLLAWFSLWSLRNVLSITLITFAIGALFFITLVPKAALWPPKGSLHPFKLKLRQFWANPILTTGPSSISDPDTLSHFAFYQMLSTVIVILILQADVWLMGYYLTPNQIGVYNIASRFTLPLTILLGALNTALWPRVSALRDINGSLLLLKKTFLVSLLIALLTFIYALIVPLLATSLFGASYSGSVFLGQLLCIRYCFAICICPIGIIGYNFGIVRFIWRVNLLQLFIVVAINILLLPRIGPIASALALIINDLVGFLIAGAFILAKKGATNAAHS